MPHRAAALEELLLLWTANRNQAFQPFEELFEDKTLAEKTVYRQVTQQLPEYFATRPLIPLPDAKPMNLLDLLRAPAVGSPHSLSDQLALIRRLWKPLLGDSLERFLLIAGEILHEEELAIWMQFNPPAAHAAEAPPRRQRPAAMALDRQPAPRCRFSAIRPTNTRSSRPTRPGCPPPCSSPKAPTCGWRSSASSTAATSPASTRFPTRSWPPWRAAASIRSG